ncbi:MULTISPECIES: hypothetical protein [Bradyrhizobium]|jgi:hypothetical protein|uniref:Uncharacterized protein n=2 Tax=Bradyrhizobium quebecense TaxID=2748629 RepID=A0A939LG07_9BRAD|nr:MULTISPECIES: hypothetical protein [Bradyrhizobium]MCK7666369.1 hypothetical protein [Bradyrhizobium sp. 2S1]QIG95609.1 hypothetical protein G6P99_26575 [Bradyrhizobium sp. 6(2017)]UGA42490.1 hypothetical protein HU230_0029980 [Bradyrhizobium quebecense]UGY00088.1 hypothetical protein J4P68_0022470 [Bradyrhizobium quebecense]GIQ71576.1 hypothetical protein BraRD5C2_00120 [Bradyrhizobium sp. RD5-C2]
MTNLDELGFRQAQSFALEQLVTVYSTSGDLRWALVALVAQSIGAAWSYGRARLVKRVREAVRRLAPVGPLDSECHYC